jgi:hypothetical protein
MVLKRQYRKRIDGSLQTPPVVSHMEIKHTGQSPEQHFSTRLVAAGLAEGWLVIEGSTLTLKAQPQDLIYQIRRTPGTYPIEGNPSGVETIHYYDCILDAAQHARFRQGAQKVGV